MNPKDMTHQQLLLQAVADIQEARREFMEEDVPCIGVPKDSCAAELLRRLDEADALLKENEELRKESFALYARLNEYSYQAIYGGMSGVDTAYVLAAPVLASYRFSHPDRFDAKESEDSHEG